MNGDAYELTKDREAATKFTESTLPDFIHWFKDIQFLSWGIMKTYTIIYKTDKMQHFEMRTLSIKEFEKLMNLMDKRKGNIQILAFSVGSSQESLF